MKDYNSSVKAIIAKATRKIDTINMQHYNDKFKKGSPFNRETGFQNDGERAVSDHFRQIIKLLDKIEVSFKQYPIS